MFSKNLLKTKTFWVGIATIGFGAYQFIMGDQKQGVDTILIGLAMITGRDALAKIVK